MSDEDNSLEGDQFVFAQFILRKNKARDAVLGRILRENCQEGQFLFNSRGYEIYQQITIAGFETSSFAPLQEELELLRLKLAFLLPNRFRHFTRTFSLSSLISHKIS
jgi:hypothetical protein